MRRRLGVATVCFLCAVAFLVYPPGGSPQTSSVEFDTRWGVMLTDADKASIIRLGATSSNRRISKVTVAPLLPLSVPVATVLYEDEVIGTYIVQTSLKVDRKDPSHWTQQHLDSLTLTDGDWGTKGEYLRRVILRRFRIDGVQVTIPLDDSVSYREVAQILKAVHDNAIAWETGKISRIAVGAEDVRGVSRSGSSPLYYIGVTRAKARFSTA